ncbi:MAG: dynamin family protein [Armatimonadetes bacterium]|nr:dynamin family protein [Armatimonadota bacterium]
MSTPHELIQASERASVDLTEVVRGLVNYTAKHGPDRHWRNLVGLQEQLAARAFNLVVFGEFKRGKSTMINALIGHDILPSAVVPLTSIITVVRYGNEVECRVTFQDGRREQIQVRDLSAYVSESGNPENAKQVAIVEVRVPSPLLASGLFLVDTPGVGSIYQHNTEVTQSFLDQVDGALLVLAADPPISQSELSFVREILGRTSRIFVVLNKVDQLSPTEREEALDFTRQVLATVLPEDALEVLPVSARHGVEANRTDQRSAWEASGVARLSARLQRFAEDDLLPTLHKSIARRAGAVAEELKLAVDLHRRSLELSVEELRRSVKLFRSERDLIMHEVNDSKVLVRTNVDRVVRTRLQEDFEMARAAGMKDLKARYAEWADEPRFSSFEELHTELNEFLEDNLRKAIAAWKDEEEQGKLAADLEDALKRFGDRIQEKLAQVYSAARKHFDLPEPRIADALVLPSQSKFEWRERSWKVQLGTGFKWHWALMGEERKKAAMLREGEKVLLQQFDQACGRLRYDFESRLRQGAEDYMDTLVATLEQALGDIDIILDQLVEQRRAATHRRDQELADLAARGEFLETQLESLEDILSEGSPARRRRERLVAIYAAALEAEKQLEDVLLYSRPPVGIASPLTPLDIESSKAVAIRTRRFLKRLREFVGEQASRELEQLESPQPPLNTLVWARTLMDRLKQIASDLTLERVDAEGAADDPEEAGELEELAETLARVRGELLGIWEEAHGRLPLAPED